MTGESDTHTAQTFFRWVTSRSKSILALSLLAMVLAAAQLPSLVKDARTDAFIPADHPALHYREQVRETFGLHDPMVIAIVNDGPNGVFTPHSLGLVHWITQELALIPNVDPERITSLATENRVQGTAEGMVIEPFLEPLPATPTAAAQVRGAVMSFPLYVGTLVARDGSATLVVVELLDEMLADATYSAVQELLQRAPVSDETLLVAGEAAVGGYWSAVIDRDSRRLQPYAALVILLTLAFAFRTPRGALLPMLVVGATVAGTLGTMAALGVPYFAITNALPVILIGIAVADSIHIFSRYYEEQARSPGADAPTLVVRTMVGMWRPVTLTSLTTMAGFFGIAVSSQMPPMAYFGWFALLGVGIALVYSLLLLPAALALLAPRGSPVFRLAADARPDPIARLLTAVGAMAGRWAGTICALALVLTAAGILAATQLEVDRSRIANINTGDPLHVADREINQRFNGTSYIDIVIDTQKEEGLFEPEQLKRIERLQAHVATLPHVQGSTSLADHLKQINRAMNGDRNGSYHLPRSADLTAQYLLLHAATGDPTALQQVVDYGYRTANVRAFLNSDLWSDGRAAVEAIQGYLDTEFADTRATTALSGRVTLDYHWLRDLGADHFGSVLLALALVWMVASLTFRSAAAGTLATVPVTFAVLLVYGAMAALGLTLEPATSMFAAIAIGLGVDFSIHTLERLIELMRERGHSAEEALALLFPSTGRALLFNFAAIFFGFSVLLTSELPTIARFGALVAVAVLNGFVAGLLLLPALVVFLRPRFLQPPAPATARGSGVALSLAAVFFAGLVLPGGSPRAEPLPSGDEIAQRIDQRDDGGRQVQVLRMVLTDRSGAQRIRDTRVFREEFEGDKRTAIFFTGPKRLQGTGFLTWDYDDPARADDQWLYLPAARRVRRISASDRGDYFLGTDFTYEDVKKQTKLALEDYDFEAFGVEEVDGMETYLLAAVPKNQDISRELGYSRVLARVRPDIWMPVMVEYTDIAGNPLKTVRISEIRQHQGIWTPFRIEAENHKTGHHSLFEYLEVSYEEPVDPVLLTTQGLQRGL